jgi:hypothetical protein
MGFEHYSNEEKELNNLLFNLASGLELNDLSEREIKLLLDKFGPNWKTVLGYNSPEILLERALNELKEWHEHDKSLNSPNVRNETTDIISEIETFFATKGKIV